MSENLQFIYKEEFWYVSAFINSAIFNAFAKSKEIESLILNKLKSLIENDIYRKELRKDILDITKNITLQCKWVPYIENFPYKDENSERQFDTIGYFQFDVEYFKDNPVRKENLNPMLIQQVPYILLTILKDFADKEENEGLFLDIESPIFIFVTSNRTLPSEIVWNPANIEKYKKIISYWTEIYSGQWDDYSETLFNKRIENNLSNRLSELHYIRRNSGFIYMANENYKNFFESYMKPFVLDPTPKMRAVLFALRSINESLDLLFLKTQSELFQDLTTIEKKIKNLRLLRGLIQTNLSIIYNELDYNRRQHYTSILKYLLNEFEIEDIVNRINQKFDTIYAAIQDLYHKKSEENQERTERGLNLLNLLFGAGILADLAGVIMIALNLQEGGLFSNLLNGFISLVIIGILFTTIFYYIYVRVQSTKLDISHVVDAVIEDNYGNVVLIKRRFPPFQNYYALPGGAIEKGESPKKALIREIYEETNLKVKIERKINVYKKEGRDPRGNIHSTAYKCSIIGDSSSLKSGDDAKEVILIHKSKLKNYKLAFDHKDMIKDANLIE
ncbi:MAG: NUDIX domain-containing protein [Candidatus Lokiarchaeota archaeon]|nr:NUDIX domain-containing protein [Candidatus Lokiarchaeota archaeon]